MIVREFKRLGLFALPLFILLYTLVSFYKFSPTVEVQTNKWTPPVQNKGEPEAGKSLPNEPPKELPQGIPAAHDISQGLPIGLPQEIPAAHDISQALPIGLPQEKPAGFGDVPPVPAPAAGFPASNDFGLGTAESTRTTHLEVFSTSTQDKKFFPIEFGEMRGMNPNIIPHPHLDNTWIIVAQEARGADEQTVFFAEISCNAAFQNGALRCILPATKLPIVPTTGDKCVGKLTYFNFNVGPHDARVLYGPDKPYTIYGSNSAFTCFGQWIQDFRELVGDWVEKPGNTDFKVGTELQRPSPWGVVEKNWFPFWDGSNQMYAHYDVAPKRAFAKVNPDGSVGEDLAPQAAASDDQCFRKYMPKLPPELESIHQATNSLKITLCNRADPTCVANDANTFIFTIWQHKTFYHFHGVYEPYVMLFQQQAPFLVHAISRKPIWIHGRQEYPERRTSDMFYVTSMNWKKKGVHYHGYLDDEIFLGFGIEDAKSGGIDVLASDLLANLGLCLDS
ncbi:hypothetical protein PT974_06121 [Cladobotryum mycophilum]|uniref:Uncharacterized protein n=1 Tax=Cladobotryum mycophilum TaxID=491253 RepID=A0ABR0SLX0_9HYPO